MWLFSLVWYWTGMRVASTTSHHTTTTRNPTRDSRYSRRLILGVLTSLKTWELVDAEGLFSKHLLSRGHLSPDYGEDPLLQSPWLRSVDNLWQWYTREWLSQNKETFTIFKVSREMIDNLPWQMKVSEISWICAFLIIMCMCVWPGAGGDPPLLISHRPSSVITVNG